MQEQLLLLAQLVNENKNIIKGKFGFGITSKTKGNTFLKMYYCQMFLKCLHSKADAGNSHFRIVCGLVLVTLHYS